MPSSWSVRGAAGASLLLAVFLLAACKPVTRPDFAVLPTATPHPIVTAENPPSPPLGDVTFPDDPLAFAPIATQPPTPSPSPLLPRPTPTPESVSGPVTVGVSPVGTGRVDGAAAGHSQRYQRSCRLPEAPNR